MRALFFARNDAAGVAIPCTKIVADFTRTDETGNELATEKHIVRWYRPEHIRIEDIDQAFSSIGRRPADKIIARLEIKNRIAQSDDAHELSVMPIPNQIAQTPPKTVGNGNGPGEASQPK